MKNYKKITKSMLFFSSIFVFSAISFAQSAMRSSSEADKVGRRDAVKCQGCALTSAQSNELRLLVHEYWILLSKFCDLVCGKEPQFKRQTFHEQAYFLKESAQKLLKIIDKIEAFYKRVKIPGCCQQGVLGNMRNQIHSWLANPKDIVNVDELKSVKWWGPFKVYPGDGDILHGWSETD